MRLVERPLRIRRRSWLQQQVIRSYVDETRTSGEVALGLKRMRVWWSEWWMMTVQRTSSPRSLTKWMLIVVSIESARTRWGKLT